jgi:hypothetical protein
MTLKTNSLSFRLIAGAAIWSLFCLVIGGFVLSSVFRNAVEHSFDDPLIRALSAPSRVGIGRSLPKNRRARNRNR